MNMKRRKEYLFWMTFGIFCLLLFIATWIRRVGIIGHDKGLMHILQEPTIIHKIGEVLLLGPFFIIFMGSFTQSRQKIYKWINIAAIPMLVGGVLNLYAWFELKDLVFWHPLCLFIFAWGMVAVPLCRKYFIVRAMKEPRRTQRAQRKDIV